MTSSMGNINLALGAVLAEEQSMRVTEQNVANASTPGYRRQSAALAAAPSYALGFNSASRVGLVGQGVTVESIQRFTSAYLDTSYRASTAAAQQGALTRDALTQVQSTLNETGASGLTQVMDNFSQAWQALAADPTNTSLRTAVAQSGHALASAFNGRAQALLDARTRQDQGITSDVAQVNQLATQVAQLNSQVAQAQAAGNQPNDLLDQRDTALDKLGQLAGAVSYTQANGEVTVSIGGHALVTGTSTSALTAAPDPANSNLQAVTWSDGQSFRPASGDLGGLLNVRDQLIPAQQAGLNATAQALAQRVNALQSAGTGLPPANSTGLPFFNTFATTNYALEITVNPAMDTPANIAAAGAANQAGDGSVALAIAGVQNEKLMSGGTATLNQAYTAQVSALGLAVQQATQGASDQQLVAGALDGQRQSVSGVSLDEEAAHLVQQQQAYNAAARLMTTMDDMLNTVISGMGRVGL